MKKTTKIILLSLLAVIVLAAGYLVVVNSKKTNDFPDWEPQAESLAALKEYVEDVTRPGSPNFIPVEDRIAVCDMDGTLYCEKAPIYGEGVTRTALK